MRFAKGIARPIYRTFFERPLWWFLGKVKAFFFAEVTAQLNSMEQRLQAIERSTSDSNSAAQWAAMEQLLLAMFRQRESSASESDWEGDTLTQAAAAGAGEVNRVNAPNTLR